MPLVMEIGLCVGILLLSVAVVGGVVVCAEEKRTWNNGICVENGLPWERFDTDSHGGRGYKAGDRYIWISYNVDK